MSFLCPPARALAVVLLLALPAAAEFEVKVSLSAEDPDVNTLETDAETVDFFLFIDGKDTRGGEFGIAIEGGEFVQYVLDTGNAWIVWPMANPYPGTIAQVGNDCYEAPVLLGKMTVRPAEPGGAVSLDVIPSMRAQDATMIHCDETGAYTFRAYPASVNCEPGEPHAVVGDHEPAAPRDEDDNADGHDGHDHSGHGHDHDH